MYTFEYMYLSIYVYIIIQILAGDASITQFLILLLNTETLAFRGLYYLENNNDNDAGNGHTYIHI